MKSISAGAVIYDDKVMTDTNDIRSAVQRLSKAYNKSAEPLFEAGGIHAEPETEAERRAEAILYASNRPLSAAEISEALPPGTDIARTLLTLKERYKARGVVLVEVAGKWRFQTSPDLAFLFHTEKHDAKQLSQAALETLAIIAYGQPVSRAEIEAVRGVAVSRTTLDQLLEAGWIRIKGRRRTPGRPVIWGTTDSFMEHFGLQSLDQLPGKAELQAEGLLSDLVPEGFETGDLFIGGESSEGSEIPENTGEDAAFSMDFHSEDDS